MLELVDNDRAQQIRIRFSGGYSVAAQSEDSTLTLYGENVVSITHHALKAVALLARNAL